MTTAPPARVALITGGNRGLGRSTAEALARMGDGIIITYRANAAEAANVVEALEAIGATAAALQLEVGAIESFDAFVGQVEAVLDERFDGGRLSSLVNNAGEGFYAPFEETTEAQYDHMFNVHLKGVFFLTQKLLPLLGDGGRIVNLSSVTTRHVVPGYSAYSAAKGALEILTRYLAAELGPRGITVNALAPGAVATDFEGGVVRDDPALRAEIGSRTALGRVADPEDIGPAIAALTTTATAFITGERIDASGGEAL